MEPLLLSAIGLGFVLGLKHATDPDHVTAVSTIVGEQRSLFASAMVGLSWGLGPSATLFLIAVPALVFRLTIPSGLGAVAEIGVGVVLVILGLLTLRDLRRKRLHVHHHEHGGADASTHLHFHSHLGGTGHGHGHRLALRPRSIVVGLFQGTAGSAALMLIVLTTIDSPLAGLAYVVVYDLAVILGIFVFSVAIGLPFTLASSRVLLLNRALRLATALASIVVGVVLAWEAAPGL